MSTDLVLGDTQIEVHADRLVLKEINGSGAEVIVKISDGNLVLGGDGADGDILLHDRAGNLTIGLNGESGSLHLGGTSEDGDVVLYDRDGKQTAHINGEDGSIAVEGRISSPFAFRVTSDATQKAQVAPVQNAQAAIMALNGVTYHLKGRTGPRQAGFVAQDVQDVIPEAVSAAADGTLLLEPTALLPFLVETIKSQEQRIADLERRIAGNAAAGVNQQDPS